MYDLSRLKGYLNTIYIGQTIIQYDELNSTVVKARSIFDKCPNGTVVLSENQTIFKIRFGREWSSYPDKNIYLSIILKPALENYMISKFDAIASSAVCESVSKMFTNINCKTKWPNDILINNKKICSVSCDLINKKNKIQGIIVSLGINVNIEDNEIDDELKQIATSIKEETQTEVEREMLISLILNNFETYYDELINCESIIKAISVCVNSSILIGKDIEITKPGKKTIRKVTATDIDDDGWLMVTNDKGNEEIINSGEISIKYETKA